MLPPGPYNPQEEEPKILKFWLDNNFYKPEYNPEKDKVVSFEEMLKDPRPTFCIINPPPNAYGRPHLGNVSGYAYQDLLLRYHRMKGYLVYGQPGKDHAGIQGEIVVLREYFRPKGITKANITREQFYKETYEYFMRVKEQAKQDEQRIGLSSDFDRDVFTLDPDIVDIVLDTFIKLYKDGYVYKGVRIVNWCPSCKTALADIDTEPKERETDFVYIKYPLLRQDQRVWRLSIYNRDVLNAILQGKKTIETRALNPEEPERFFGDIKQGDIVVFVDKSKEGHRAAYPFVAKRVAIYKSLKELYEQEDVAKINSRGKKVSYEEFEAGYASLADGYLEKIKKNGMVAIELESYKPGKDFITVATTRPETMLGDTAVVVNPNDKRYKELIGRKVLLPLVWREIPIISDPIVDKTLGTGALKLTPAHAYEDYQIMLNWNQEHPDEQVDYVNVIDKDAKMTGPVGKYYGLNTQEAREEVVEDLKKLGLIEKIEQKEQRVYVCERCKTVIEPQMSSQWFIKVDELKKPATEVVEKDIIKIHPRNMKKVYLDWMKVMRDWPISRSLWWGYRFPVWYKGKVEEKIDEEGKVTMYIDGKPVRDFKEAEKLGLAKVSKKSPGKGWIQSDYVFDTWFSSGQWPFATLMKFGLFEKFYPTDVMETAYDILKWWVSRMVMLGIYRTGKIPFKHVYFRGLIKGKDGQKMSKSKGNIVLPAEVIDKYGADVLRLFYIVGNKAGAAYQITEDKLEGNKRFLNKMWNASRFVLMNINDVLEDLPKIDPNKLKLTTDDKKMISEVNSIVEKTKKYIEDFKFGIIAVELRDHFWHVFCDWYLEAVKPRLRSDDSEDKLAAQYTLYYALKQYLKIFHPYIPFITERIWQEFPKGKGEHRSLMYTRI